MHWIKLYLFAWIFTLVIFISPVHSSGIFELRLKYFSNELGRDNEGKCCSGHIDSATQRCTGTCKTRFRVCLKHYQAKIDITSQCTFGDVYTPVLGENSINLQHNLTSDNSNSNYQSSNSSNNMDYSSSNSQQNSGFLNPIPFQFNFAWPGTFTLIVEAWHDTDNETYAKASRVLISRLSLQGVLNVSSNWTEKSSVLKNSTLLYDYRVLCENHYYGAGCANLCRPRDDNFGHYTCSDTGEIICLSGWYGDYCEKPRCLKGCNELHGHCSKPNECSCSLGWKGSLCNECELYPGCIHGTCSKPWECLCNEGWGGLFCNQDLNYCTNHRPCQNGGTCRNTGSGLFTCECPPGYTGSECDKRINSCEDFPCLNGGSCHDDHDDSFNQSYRCECKQGWSGMHCEKKRITCAEKPCLHGKCRDTKLGFQCECPAGYSGINCEQTQTDECSSDPCQHGGTCVQKSNGASAQCLCKSGFIGDRCEKNVDDCNGNPCLNGGTCVDLVNQFRCSCVPGFIGSLCSEKVDLCLTKPCANGGSCTTLSNDYKCQCRPGFTGKDCSTDIDECASNPCRNGATCVNRVNSFQCLCAWGFEGVQCGDEVYAPSFGAHQYGTLQSQNDGLTSGQVVLIAILSVAMPVVAVIAACVVICMKRKRKRDQEKDDAEARKQNEQNATAHHGTTLSSKRSSSSGLTFDNSNPNIIKNTWDKSVNNISSSASVDDCLLTTSLYGAMSNYSDNNANSDFCSAVPTQLQRAKSQKQLNTDPSLMHRTSQLICNASGGTSSGNNNNNTTNTNSSVTNGGLINSNTNSSLASATVSGGGGGGGGVGGLVSSNSAVNTANQQNCTKEFLLDSKRMSVLGESQFNCNQRWPSSQTTTCGGQVVQTRSQVMVCSPPHM